MVDESQEFEPKIADETEPEPEERRSSRGVVTAIAVIVIVVLILLLFRACGSSDKSGATSGGGKSILPVAGMPPQPGAVSVWVIETSDIDAILKAESVIADNVVNMGGSRYVFTVPQGTESAVVKRLKNAQGVEDAGLVYLSGKAK